MRKELRLYGVNRLQEELGDYVKDGELTTENAFVKIIEGIDLDEDVEMDFCLTCGERVAGWLETRKTPTWSLFRYCSPRALLSFLSGRRTSLISD